MSSSKIRSRRRGNEDWLWKGVNSHQLIGAIEYTTLEPDSSLVSSASKPELLCTYDWQDRPNPTVLVPGNAPAWTDQQLPITIPEDHGVYFVDQNAARLPEYPLEPIFHATASMNPSFRFDDVDVVVNRNTLRKLFEFGKNSFVESFRVNLYIVKNTLFIERCSQITTERVRQNGGYGRTFEKQFTKSTNESTGHHRVLRYHLGMLNCVVRFEVDASYQENQSEQVGDLSNGSLATAIEGLVLESSKRGDTEAFSPKFLESSRLKSIFTTEEAMPQSIAAEIKTFTEKRGLRRHLNIPQLWFGRTHWLIAGRHNNGTFDGIDVSYVKPEEFIDWEIQFQEPLRKMVTVIAQLRDIVEKNKGFHCVAIFEQKERPKVIKIYASSSPGKKPLPKSLIKHFWTS
ncbi:hypothetical protein EYR41_002236 [Orbilia oligospora]|uniref:Geranylgeranyl pyrophosphate synthetase n=1 Tax=Orbilia oligospora TaxID=2813651 RepID=A0A8H2DKF0_ORBOL|nr:hypothetical protein EYR41_002236 [Orbilia oligospora]